MATKWQVVVKNFDGKPYTVDFNKPKEEICVAELKQKINDKIHIPPKEQRLLYGGKQLQDQNLLSDYPTLGPGSTIFVLLRLLGGSRKPFDPAIERTLPRHLPKSDEECFICFEGPALVMPCKHSCCSTCVTNFAWNEVSSKARNITINCSLCDSEWGLDVIQQYGKTTREEINLLAECLSMNVIRSDPSIIECPGCKRYCERMDKTVPRVRCRVCEMNGRKNSYFCWFCLQPWKDTTNPDCSNPQCNAAGILKQLESAPIINIVGVSCPSRRLCPRCGAAYKHEEGCKQMKCKNCKAEFCFICLRMKVEGSWQCGSYNTKCNPAPRQTHIPKLT